MPQQSNSWNRPEELAVKDKNLLLFLGLRPLVISLLIFLSYPTLFDIPRPFIFILIAAAILVSIFYLLANVLLRTAFYYIVFLVDTVLITLLVVNSGGSESLFPLLYPLVILASSIYLYRGAIFIAFFSFVIYSLMVYIELRGGLFPVQYFYSRTYLYAILLFLVAYLSSNLATRVRRTEITTAEIIGSLPIYIAAIDKQGQMYYSNITDARIKDLIIKFYRSKRSYAEHEIDDKIFSFSSHPLTINPKLRLLLIEDITKERKMAERTRLYEKLKLLAQLGASLAHEIRNPLASIRGTVEIIAKTELEERHGNLLTLAIGEVDRVSRTIDDFLEFSRMRPLKLRRVKLKSIIDDFLSVDPHPENIEMKLSFPDSMTVRVDRYLMYRVLSNLIYNARQAIGSKEGAIEIASKTDNNTIDIIVSDNGCGIPKRNLKKIFKPFFSTREDGTGLGLSIVETIINQHGGSISVESYPHKGTIFTISLPKRYG